MCNKSAITDHVSSENQLIDWENVKIINHLSVVVVVYSGVFNGGAFSHNPPRRVVYLIFLQRMDVWCEAFCCRHINFKTCSRVHENTPFSFRKLNNFLGRGTAPYPGPTPTGGGYPSRTYHGASTQPLALLLKS